MSLMDIFATIKQFKLLAENENKFEGIEPLIVSFYNIITKFRNKNHNVLDIEYNEKFENDFNAFILNINELENSLSVFIDQSFEATTTIENSLILLKKFQKVIYRPELKLLLNNKLSLIFNNYGMELISIQDIYEKNKQNPPNIRNMPPVAASIIWSRHLLKRIEDPMLWFQDNPQLISSLNGNKKIIKLYNKLANLLISFEMMWYEAWEKSIQAGKAGLEATLLIKHPKTNKLYVNFDREIFQLIR